MDFSALEILLLRFLLAFIALWIIERFQCVARGNGCCKEWIFAAMGFTGIVAYQFLENCAIYYTNASNVAILVSFGPIVTALMARALTKDRQLSARLVGGSLISICGVSLVSLNGIVEFELRPIGDVMALCAMASWGLYSILIDVVNERGPIPTSSTLEATRKFSKIGMAMGPDPKK